MAKAYWVSSYRSISTGGGGAYASSPGRRWQAAGGKFWRAVSRRKPMRPA